MRWVGSEAARLKRVISFILGGILLCSTLVVAGTGDLTSRADRLLVQTQPGSDSGDAGTGADASELRTAPTRLPGPGRYSGSLDSSSDVDWFGLSPDSTNVCVEAAASGTATTQVTLDIPGLATVRTEAHKGQNRAVDMALAGAGASDLRFGFTDGHDRARAPGSWSFELETFTPRQLLADGDAGSGADAGDTTATASRIDEGCSGGTLPAGDAADVYQIDAKRGDTLTFSLAGLSGITDVQADLLDATGETLMTVGHNDVGTYTFDARGTYHLKVHTDGDRTLGQAAALDAGTDLWSHEDDDGYILGLDGPEPRPCDPSC